MSPRILRARSMAPSEVMERFRAVVQQIVPDSRGCLNWPKFRSTLGYGVIAGRMPDRHSWFTHRLSYMNAYGAIPPGLCVCHRCDNPACVNPDHLELGTPEKNLIDAGKRNLMRIGEDHPAAKLSQDEALRIYSLRGLIPAAELARHVGVSANAIRDIFHRRRWKKVLPK